MRYIDPISHTGRMKSAAWLNNCRAAFLYPPDFSLHSLLLLCLRYNRKWADFPEESAVRAATANRAATDKIYLMHKLNNQPTAQNIDIKYTQLQPQENI